MKILVLGCCFGLATGCGNSDKSKTEGVVDMGAADLTPPVDMTGDTPSTVYPAIRPTGPQLTNSGGPILSSPVFVAVTFPNEALLTDIEAFTSQVGATSYWSAVTSEYGIGAGTGGTPVHLTEIAPTTIKDSEIRTWLAGHLEGTHDGFPAPAVGQVFAIFYPTTTTVTLDLGGTSSVGCKDFGAYHSETKLSNGMKVAYAIMPRCPSAGSGATDLEQLTLSASHEFVEASEDPFPGTQPAYQTVDFDHIIYGFLGGEGADLCEIDPSADYIPTDFPYAVQKAWSNKSALAGHNPCVPLATNDVYYNAILGQQEAVDIPEGLTNDFTAMSSGWMIGAGTSQTIDVQLYSDAATSGEITVKAVDYLANHGANKMPSNLAFAFDRTSGVNGDTVHLTITVKGESQNGFEIFAVRSTVDSKSHSTLGLIEVP